MLGILGGLGPAASCYLYQMLIDHTPAQRDQDHIDVVISSRASTPDRTAFILGQSADDPFDIMEQDGANLVRYGATVLAIPCNTAHYFYDRLAAALPVPVLNMPRLTVADAKAAGCRRLGILATDGTLAAETYQLACREAGLPCAVPAPERQRDVMSVIYDDIKQGRRADMAKFNAAADDLRAQGCDRAVLGCTELSLVKRDERLGAFFIDSTEVLCRHALLACGIEPIGFEQGGEHSMESQKKFYITTPIYYPSDKLHIGHTYCTVATDAMARYKRLQGCKVMFLTGTDEHGQKIELKAKDAGVTPQQFVDNIVEGPKGVKDLWKLMNISYDRFIRTTDDYHVAAIQRIFKKMYEKGDIYKGVYKGKYCTPCESFWTESQLVNGCCPDCGRPVVDAEEEAYFFRLSKYADRVRDLLVNTDFLLPRSRVNEMVHNFIDPGLEDLCVSRTSFSWGIPVDFDPKHVVYVWIDALFNYTTALGFMNGKYPDSEYEEFWPADVHFIGKEIVRFHSIIWPAMLMSMEMPLPKHVYGHGWLLLDGGKMSKSKGNVVDPYLLAERYSADALRYFLLRDFPFGSDGNFSNELLINRINMDLANDLGNLLSRTTAMADKYFGGTLPEAQAEGEQDAALIEKAAALRARYEADMESYAFQNALADVFEVIDNANKYIDATAPWVLAKNEADKPRLARVLYNLAETLRICTVLLQPFMPCACEKIFAQLNVGADLQTWDSAAAFGALPAAATLHKGENLFPRIDTAKELAELETIEAAQKAAAQAANAPAPQAQPAAGETAADWIGEHEPEIKIDDFEKVELRVAEVRACERMKESKKLLHLTVFDGERERCILSGIAKQFAPEELIGKKIGIVANLAPRPMMKGKYVSEGMIVAADTDAEGGCAIAFYPDSVPAGARIH